MREETFTCPDCGWISANLEDVRFRYCGNCHEFKGETDWQELASRTPEQEEEFIKRVFSRTNSWHYDYEGDPRYCGKRAMAAGVEVACWRPYGHVEDYHQGPRAEGEQFTWNPKHVETMPPRR